MKRKLLFVIPLFFIVLLLVNVAGATWSLSDSYGNWKTLSNVEWETPKDKLDYDATFTKSGVTIVTSWVFALSLEFDTWFNWEEFWVSHSVQHTTIFELSNLGKTIKIKVEGDCYRNLASVGSKVQYLELQYKIDTDDWKDMGLGRDRCDRLDFRLYFFKKSDTELNFVIYPLTVRNGDIVRGYSSVYGRWVMFSEESYFANETFTVPSGFFSDVDLKQTMAKQDDGWIHGYKDGETFDVYTEPYETLSTTVDYLGAILKSITTPIYNMLPDWARAIIDVFSGIGAIFVNTILPNLAVLLSAYIIVNLGLGFQNLSENVTDMSDLNVNTFKDIIIDAFKPLYDLFLWIVSFITRVAQLIMEILPF